MAGGPSNSGKGYLKRQPASAIDSPYKSFAPHITDLAPAGGHYDGHPNVGPPQAPGDGLPMKFMDTSVPTPMAPLVSSMEPTPAKMTKS